MRPLGVASRQSAAGCGHKQSTHHAGDRIGIGADDQFFSVTVAADEVARPKPDPELYVRAFELLSAKRSDGVALEDSSTGVASAQAAGAFVVTVPSQPGKDVPGHHLAVGLDDDAIVEWARTVHPL